MFLYNQVYSPMQGTMFALLAFFIASRRFARSGSAPWKRACSRSRRSSSCSGASPWRPAHRLAPEHLRVSAMQDWIMNVPQNAAKRAILIGAAMGVMATGLRVILASSARTWRGD